MLLLWQESRVSAQNSPRREAYADWTLEVACCLSAENVSNSTANETRRQWRTCNIDRPSGVQPRQPYSCLPHCGNDIFPSSPKNWSRNIVRTATLSWWDLKLASGLATFSLSRNNLRTSRITIKVFGRWHELVIWTGKGWLYAEPGSLQMSGAAARWLTKWTWKLGRSQTTRDPLEFACAWWPMSKLHEGWHITCKWKPAQFQKHPRCFNFVQALILQYSAVGGFPMHCFSWSETQTTRAIYDYFAHGQLVKSNTMLQFPRWTLIQWLQTILMSFQHHRTSGGACPETATWLSKACVLNCWLNLSLSPSPSQRFS